MALQPYRRGHLLPALLAGVRQRYANNPGQVVNDARRAADIVGRSYRASTRAISEADRRIRELMPSRFANRRPGGTRHFRGTPNRRSYVRRPGGLTIPARYGGRTSRMVRRKRFRRKIRGRRSRFRRTRPSMLTHLWRKLCTPQVEKHLISRAVPGIQGQRAYCTMCMGDIQVLKALAAKRPSNFLFNSTGPSSAPVVQDFAGTNYKLNVTRYMQQLRVQNRANAHMELKIYECTFRHDTNFVPADANVSVFFSKSVNDPASLSGIGSSQSNVGPGYVANANLPSGFGTDQWHHPSFTPFMSNTFVSALKIDKVHSRILQPNEVWPVKFWLKRRTIKGQYLEGISTVTRVLAKYTKLLLFSWVGQPVDDNSLTKQTKAKTDLFIQGEVLIDFHFEPGTEPLSTLGYTYLDSTELGGATNTYQWDPTTPNMVAPAESVVQTVTGSDEVPVHQP